MAQLQDMVTSERATSGDIPTWHKPTTTSTRRRLIISDNVKLVFGAGLLISALLYLIVSSTVGGARYFSTVDEMLANPALAGQTVRITGAVIGDSIRYDSEALQINFTIAHVPQESDNLALSLHDAVNDPTVARLAVQVDHQAMPDLLQHEAQAILSGQLGADGVFYATELLLKCPSRYEEAVPMQAEAQAGA
jgi:cytochrome c-type biogenesis protein CcmE